MKENTIILLADDKNKESVIMCSIGQHKEAPQAPFSMCFTAKAFRQLILSVGTLPPETGAMAFGPKDLMGFDVIEFDTAGSSDSSGAVYRPSVEWGEKRRDYHLDQQDINCRLWTGTGHSHPGGFCHPSGKSGKAMGDLGYVEETFAMNEWMQWFFIPILTGTGTDEVTIHPWVCQRANPLRLMIADLQICKNVSAFPKRQFNPDWERSLILSDQGKKKDTEEKKETTSTIQQNIQAGTDAPNERTIQNNIQKASKEKTSEEIEVSSVKKIDSTNKSKNERGIMMNKSSSPAEAMVLGLTTSEVKQGASIISDRGMLLKEYTKRLKGIISPEFHNKTILVVGTGAGSYMVEKLGRMNPKCIKICDYDIVEISNLARTAYVLADVGKLKVEALAARLQHINPLVEIITYPHNILHMTHADLNEMFSGVDIVFAGTDSLAAQDLINTKSIQHKIPAVFIGIHAGAQGGRIVWCLPDVTPCYRCVAKERFEAYNSRTEAVDLTSVTGDIIDCQFIDMVATKIGVALLEREQNSSMGRFFTAMKNRNDIVIRCDPNYEWGQTLWHAVLADLPKSPKDYGKELNEQVFFAMDSIWLRGEFDPFCPACG